MDGTASDITHPGQRAEIIVFYNQHERVAGTKLNDLSLFLLISCFPHDILLILMVVTWKTNDKLTKWVVLSPRSKKVLTPR